MEQQGRVVPANNRYRAGEASIRSSEEQDRSRHHSAHRGGLELSTGTGLYGACRSTQCCLAVWSRWVESSTRIGGFRALKKTPEAPYTTKVNYREPTSRGTTHPKSVSSFMFPFWFTRLPQERAGLICAHVPSDPFFRVLARFRHAFIYSYLRFVRPTYRVLSSSQPAALLSPHLLSRRGAQRALD